MAVTIMLFSTLMWPFSSDRTCNNDQPQ